MPRAAKIALFVLLAAWAAAMAWIPAVDYAWTARLTEHRHDPLAGFARRTMFQGQPPGATDLSSLLALATLAAYVLACSRRADPRLRTLRALRTLRPAIGFLLVAAFVAGLAVVHALKTLLGRARPLDVLSRGHLPYTPWYHTGSLPLAGGFWRGSFPSGHTAAVFVLLALAYALLFDPAATRRARRAGAGVMALAVTGAAYMAVASAMGGNHWLSDGLGAMGLVWILVHLLYFDLLDVPAQRRRLLAPAPSEASVPSGAPVASVAPAPSGASVPPGAPVASVAPAPSGASVPSGAPVAPVPSRASVPSGASVASVAPAPSGASVPPGAPVAPVPSRASVPSGASMPSVAPVAAATPHAAPQPALPRAWEAILCGHALLVLAGATLLLLALRAGLAEPSPPNLTPIVLLASSGAGLLALGLPRALRLLRRLHAELDAAAAGPSHPMA